MNKYLTSTLLAGIFITGTVFSPATAQEQSLQPQGAWAITKVDRSAQGGNSYCTLSRKYDDGIVLSLGRNQTEEYSLAIDFQKDVFKKDKALKISLQPGPGQIRAYDMMPASEKAMVIRLGWDTGFFDTLNNSQQMKVKIADQSYAFAMPEIVKGQNDLQDCMKDLKLAAKGGDMTAPTTDVLNAQIETASGDFSAAKVEAKMPTAASIAAQKEQLAKQEKAVLESFANSIRAQEPSLNGDNKRGGKNFAKTDDNAAPAAQEIRLADAKPVPKPAEKAVVAADAKTEVKTPVPAAIAAPKAEAPVELVKRPDPVSEKEKKELQSRLAALDSENNELKKKAAGSAVDMQAKLKAVEDEKKALNEKLRAAEMEIKRKEAIAVTANAAIMDSQKAEIAALEKGLNDVMLEKAALDEKLKLAQRDAEAKAAIASNASATSEGVKVQIAAMQKRIADMGAEIADMGAENAALKQKSGVVAPEILAKIDTLEAEKKALNEKLQLTQKDAEAKAVAAATAGATSSTAQKQIAEMEGKIAALEAENKKHVAAASQAASAATLAAANITPFPGSTGEDVKKLMQQLAEVRDENAKLKQASAAASSAAATPAIAPEAIAKLESENKALADKIAVLEKSGGEKTANMENIAAMEAKMKETQIKNEQLEDSLRKAQVRIAEAALNTESKSLKQIVDLEAKLEAAKKDNLAISKQLDEAKLQQEDKQLSMVSGDATLVSATKRYNEAEREIRRLGQQVEKQKESCEVEKAQIENMLFDPAVADQKQIERLAELEAEVVALKSGRGGSAVSSSMAGGDTALREKLKMMEENLQGMKDANDEFNAQNEILRREAERLSMQLAEAQSNGAGRADKVASSNLRMEELKRELALKEKQNLTYHNQLAALQKEKDQMARTSSPGSFMAAAAEGLNDIVPSAGATNVAAKAIEKPAAYGKSNLEGMLKKAGLSVGGLKSSSSGMAGAENFSWSDNKVKGLASVKSIGNGNFTKLVDQYIADKKRSCGGDFASMPSPSSAQGAKTMALYEVACVGSSESVSSSLLFFEDQGRFIAISNDIGAADMDVAMDSRDKIASAVGGM